jgi:hypothetical protein
MYPEKNGVYWVEIPVNPGIRGWLDETIDGGIGSEGSR